MNPIRALFFTFGLTVLFSSCSNDNAPLRGGAGGSGGEGGGDVEILSSVVYVSPVTGIQTIVSRRDNMPTMELSGLQAKGHVQLFSDATCTTAISEKIPTFKPTQSFGHHAPSGRQGTFGLRQILGQGRQCLQVFHGLFFLHLQTGADHAHFTQSERRQGARLCHHRPCWSGQVLGQGKFRPVGK